MTSRASHATPVAADSRAEWRLLLACVRGAVGAPAPAGNVSTDDATGEIDWQRLVEDAAWHGVMPLLYLGLAAGTRPDATPISRELRDRFHENARLNLVRTAELRHAVATLDEAGVKAMPLKGPVLALTTHNSVAMRQFTDLDVLIAERDRSEAMAALGRLGYERHSTEPTSVTLIKRDPACRVVIDLQWALSEARYACPLTSDALMARARRVTLSSMTVWQPAVHDLLFILCMHPAKHCWSRLGWVADLAGFMRASAHDIDWRTAVDDASRLGIRRQLLLGVSLASELCAAASPVEIRDAALNDRSVNRLAGEICLRLHESSSAISRLNGTYGVAEAGLLYMQTRERLADKWPYVRFLVALACQWWSPRPSERDHQMVTLPPLLSPLYVPLRVVRQAVRYGPRLVRWGVQAMASLR